MPDNNRYSDEQVEQILFQAINNPQHDGFSRSQLIEMADELGISAEALEKAENLVQAVSPPFLSQTPAPTRSAQPNPPAKRTTVSQSLSSSPTPIQHLNRNGFSQHLAVYLIVNGMLLGLNFMLSGAITWAIYSVLGWGVGLACHPFRSSNR